MNKQRKTSSAHVLPSWFIQHVPSSATLQAWILLIDSTFFLVRVEDMQETLSPYDDLAMPKIDQ